MKPSEYKSIDEVSSPSKAPLQVEQTDDPILGCMSDYGDELDEIVEVAMRRRQISGWLPDREAFKALEAMSEATGQSIYLLLDEALRQYLGIDHARTAEEA